MTILGAVVEPGRALVWTDTETYVRRQPAGERPKLAVNPLGIVSIGSGSCSLIAAAEAVLHRSLDIDRVEQEVPGRLRSRAAEIAAECTNEQLGWCSGETFLAVGFSPSFARMICWEFSGRNFFAPILCSRLASPGSEEIYGLLSHIAAPAHVIRIGRRQMTLLREHGLEAANGGTLTVAEVTETSVRCWRYLDFDVSPLTAPESPHPVEQPSPDERGGTGAMGPGDAIAGSGP